MSRVRQELRDEPTRTRSCGRDAQLVEQEDSGREQLSGVTSLQRISSLRRKPPFHRLSFIKPTLHSALRCTAGADLSRRRLSPAAGGRIGRRPTVKPDTSLFRAEGRSQSSASCPSWSGFKYDGDKCDAARMVITMETSRWLQSCDQ